MSDESYKAGKRDGKRELAERLSPLLNKIEHLVGEISLDFTGPRQECREIREVINKIEQSLLEGGGGEWISLPSEDPKQQVTWWAYLRCPNI